MEAELALIDALLLRRPRAIRAFAKRHPPAWFVSDAALAEMRALYCCSAGGRLPSVDDVVASLDAHGALEVAGGEDRVRALASGPALAAAMRDLERFVETLPLPEREAIELEEALDDLESSGVSSSFVVNPDCATEAAPDRGGGSPPDQLLLF